MSIQIKRQGEENAISCSDSPLKPNILAYGELAIDSFGYIYSGNGQGKVVSLSRAADRAALASSADIATNAIYASESGKSSMSDESVLASTSLISNNSVLASTAEISKDSNLLGGHDATFFAEATEFNKIPFLYSAFFSLDEWRGEGPYSQTVEIIAEDDGPNISDKSIIFSGPMCEQTNVQETNELLQETLNILNSGYLMLGNNQITAQVFEQPSNDIKIFLVIKTKN